jgi:hypothetical protein
MSYMTKFRGKRSVICGHQSDFTASEGTANVWVHHPHQRRTSEGAIVAEELIGEKMDMKRLTKSIMVAAMPHFVEKASLSILLSMEKGVIPLNDRLHVMQSFPGSPALSTAPSGETMTFPLASFLSLSHMNGKLIHPPATLSWM